MLMTKLYIIVKGKIATANEILLIWDLISIL